MANLKNTRVTSTAGSTVASGTSAQRPAAGVTTTVQTFTATGPGTFAVPTGVSSVEVLVVAGGGAGGAAYAGGGGAGGVVYHSQFPVTPGGTVSYSVGAGGTAGPTDSGLVGDNGAPSTFGSITAIGGGGGGSYVNNIPGLGGLPNGRPAADGGSGGGGHAETEADFRFGRATQGPSAGGVGYGFPGGRGSTRDTIYRGGGGGGAGGAGQPGDYWHADSGMNFNGGGSFQDNSLSGSGGIGRPFDISGTLTYYGGGGGGGKFNVNGSLTAGLGGRGGGGAGIVGPGTATSGTANTGGGGGGGGGVGAGQAGGLRGGNGGPGVIIVRYFRDTAVNTTAGGHLRYNTTTGAVEGSEQNRIHKLAGKTVQSFTSVGSATFSVPVGINEVHVLVVAGGGAGGTSGGGGGGAGGFIEEFRFPVAPGGSIPVVVGGGGSAPGGNGGNSSFGSLIATGGGGGGIYSDDAGNPGGSGGGSTGTGPGQNSTNVGQGTQGQGYPGGIGRHSPGFYVAGGGGGGAAEGGQPSIRTHNPGPSGFGGNGRVSYITGSATYYSGGGAGAGSNSPTFVIPSYGGVGGGGDSTPGAGNPGTTNTGGGGAGGNHNGGGAGNGGPGIVIVRF